MLISGIITEGIHGLLIWLSVQLFKIAAFVFEIFIILSTGELITQDSYEVVIQNFYILLGIIMLFVVAFTLLKGMVNADDSTKGATTIKKMIINLITSAIIMAVLPAIFAFMYDFQESFIVRQNTIGKFFGYGTVGDPSDSPIEQKNLNLVESASYKIVNGVFTAFFNITTGTCAKTEKTYSGSLEECQKAEESNNGWWFWESDSISVSYKTQDGYTKRIQLTNLHEAINFVDEYGDFSVYTAFAENVDEGSMDFSFLLSLVAGGFLIYIAVSYCFDMALRLVKLVFYQLIAPIPIFFRVIPEGKMNGMFDKWMKITITCYLEVFIRIFIFYFCVFLCTKMMEAPFLTEDVYKYGFMTGFLTKAFVLMGIITFMKQAPKLFSEVTGIDTGNMSLGIKEKFAAGGGFAIGAGIGGLIAGRGNPLSALRAGAAGARNKDFKGIGAEVARREDLKDALASGATRRQIMKDRFRNYLGLTSSATAQERKIKTGNTVVSNNSSSDISYVDGKGVSHTIKSGRTAEINDITAEELKSKKTQNIGAIAEANDRIRDIDKKIKWAGSQAGWKSDLDKEADSKFNAGKFNYTIRYQDSKGNFHKETINGERFEKLSGEGVRFLSGDASLDKYTVTYTDKAGVQHVAKEMTSSQILKIEAEGGKVINEELEYLTAKQVTDEVRAAYTTTELASSSSNGVKTKTEAFFTTLANEGGFSFEGFKYGEDGRMVYKDGKPVVEKGSITSHVDSDNNRIISYTTVDDSGKEQTINYTSIGKGMLEYVDSDGTTKQMSMYDLSDIFDKKSKSTTGVLESRKQSISESSEYIRARDENEAIDAVLKQRDEMIEQALQSPEQRGRKASEKYTSRK